MTRLRVSHDDQTVFSVGEGGSLAVFDVRTEAGSKAAGGKGPKGKAGKAKPKEAAVPYAEEILVTKSDLEEKTALMQELKNKVRRALRLISIIFVQKKFVVASLLLPPPMVDFSIRSLFLCVCFCDRFCNSIYRWRS